MALTFFSAKARLAELEAQVKDAGDKLDAANLEREAAVASLADMTKRAEKAEAVSLQTFADLEAARKEVEAKEVSVEDRASKKALTIVGSAGTSAIADTGASKSDGQLVEEFNAITDPAKRGEFYTKHFAEKFKR